jgi:hypothetical protein
MQGVLINCNMRENLYMDNIMFNDLQQQTGKTSSIFLLGSRLANILHTPYV